MADEQPQPGAEQAPLSINILAQYVKDLSFENPRAPASLSQQAGQPQIDLGVSVDVNRNETAGPDVYEVLLKMNANGTTNEGKDTAFVVELVYGGLFKLQNVPQEHLNLFLLVEAPRLLFPFARNIFAGAVRDGGFPPLMLDPIDFAQLYMQQQAQAQGQSPDGIGNGGGEGGGSGGAGGGAGSNGGSDTPNIILPS